MGHPVYSLKIGEPPRIDFRIFKFEIFQIIQIKMVITRLY